MDNPSIRQEIERMYSEIREDAKASADKTFEEFRSFVMGEHKHIAVTLKSEQMQVRHNRNGLEAIGMIQPAGRVQVNAQAGAASGNTFEPLYESPKLARVREAGGRVAFDAQVEANAATLEGGDGLVR